MLTIRTRKANIHDVNFYPEDLETSNVETETGIGERRETKDDFMKKQKSANKNKMATDLNRQSSALIVR